MRQYNEMKAKHPDAVLLFRVGDFYETFSQDAITASEILGITLTKRGNGYAAQVELAGFPHHALDTYLPKLVRAGKRVAICEQLEDPKLTKKLVKRGIIELVTPGVSINDNILDHKLNNFVAAVHTVKNKTGVAFLDISTGEFMVAEGSSDYADKLLVNFAPKEVLVENDRKREFTANSPLKCLVSGLDDWVFTGEAANDRLLKQFETGSLKGFGVQGMDAAVIAAGAVLHYLDITHHTQTGHISSLSRIEEERYVRLDKFTVRNLEILDTMSGEGKSLIDVIDHTVTPMGARLLRRWVLFPLKDPKAVNRRLDVVEHFFKHPEERDELHSLLAQVGDMERLVSKVGVCRVNPREMVALRSALALIEPVKEICVGAEQTQVKALGESLDLCADTRDLIGRTLNDDAPTALGRGPVIRTGFNAELDELREIAYSGKDYLLKVQQRESAETGIPSLKIGFNNVFGYYIEVTNTHRDKVPESWIRKQTLVNAERYITPELKEYEDKIITAQEKIDALESRLYTELVATVAGRIQPVQRNAQRLAELDVLLSHTLASIENRYNRPVVDDGLAIDIVEGRHPVIETQLPPGERYVSNTVNLSNDTNQIMMITGPNMSGKSALLRQTALNVLLAQIGCFVAADSARRGVVDKIFTRVGASDNISQGESTFMVEMTEAASILNNMSERSLILFDELGRGTSTYDGISIAWAIVEHIHEYGGMHPKTLFATHYHELNEMERNFPRVVNYNVSVSEIGGKVVFLRKLARGGSEHSFGIHVAKLAGMPRSIVERAGEVLKRLEDVNRRDNKDKIESALDSMPTTVSGGEGPAVQMSFFQLDDPVLSQVRDEIVNTDINNLTPMAALNKLHDIRKIITGKD